MAMLRHLCLFLLAGSAIYVGMAMIDHFYDSKQSDVITISKTDIDLLRNDYIAMVKHKPNREEMASLIQNRIDDAILVNEALKLGLHRSDSVIKERLILNMIFLQEESPSVEDGDTPDKGESHSSLEKSLLTQNGLYQPNAEKTVMRPEQRDKLFNQAIQMGMLTSDLVVVRRLKDRMEKIIANTSVTTPTDAQLNDYFLQNFPRYAQGNSVNLFHAFFSKEQISKEQLKTVVEQWKNGSLSDAALMSLATSSYVTAEQNLSQGSLNKIFGDDIARTLMSVKTPSTLDIQESPTGFHLLRVDKIIVEDKNLIDISVYKDRLLNEYMRDKENEAISIRLSDWRKKYTLHIDSATE